MKQILVKVTTNKKKQRDEVIKKIGIVVVIASFLGYLLFEMFIVDTPEKAIIWEIYRKGNYSYEEAKQADIVLVRDEGGVERLYQSKIGDEVCIWFVAPLNSRWMVFDYGPDQQFEDEIVGLSRQDMILACIEAQLKEEQCGEAELWKRYAMLTDCQVEEQYMALSGRAY